MLNIFPNKKFINNATKGRKNFLSIKDVKFVNFMSSWYFHVKILWS